MPSINRDLAALGLLDYHLQLLVSEFARNNCAFYIRYGDNCRFIVAMDDNTGAFLKLNQNYILHHLIGRVRIAIRPAPIMRYFSINLDSSNEQVKAYLKIVSQAFGIPLIFVTKNSRVYTCCFFLRSLEGREDIIKAIEYILEKILDSNALRFCKTFPGSAKWFELPFGPGCYFLNPNTLEPMKMNKQTMLEYYFNYQKNFTLTLDKLLDNVEGLSCE